MKSSSLQSFKPNVSRLPTLTHYTVQRRVEVIELKLQAQHRLVPEYVYSGVVTIYYLLPRQENPGYDHVAEDHVARYYALIPNQLLSSKFNYTLQLSSRSACIVSLIRVLLFWSKRPVMSVECEAHNGISIPNVSSFVNCSNFATSLY